MQIQGQAALVTGGASGLGEATARELARLGATATPPVVGRVPRTAGWAPRVHYTCSLDPVTQIIPAVA